MVDLIGSVLLGGLALYGLVLLVGALFTDIIPFVFWDAPRYVWFNSQGKCFKCKQPYISYASKPVDQMYASEVTVKTCRCGNSTASGDRHFAEW